MPFPVLALVGVAAAAGAAFLFARKETHPSASPLTGASPRPVTPTAKAPTPFAAPKPPFAPAASPQPPAFRPEPPPPPIASAPRAAPVIVSSGSGINRQSKDYKMWLQSALNQVNAAGLVVDGAIGPKSITAIRSYQTKRRLTADGVPGPQTEGALMTDGAPSPPGFAGVRPEPVPVFVDLDAPGTFTENPVQNVPQILTDIVSAATSALPSISASVRNSSGYKKWLQASLNETSGAGLVVDGAIGPKSIAAIKSFQSSHGLSADGVMGPNTEGALMGALVALGSANPFPPGT